LANRRIECSQRVLFTYTIIENRVKLISIEPNKTLGGVGALLLAVGSFAPFLSLVGVILLLVAMRSFADYYKDNSLFTNSLYGFIFGLIGVIAAITLFVAFIFQVINIGISSSGTSPVAVFTVTGAIGILILILAVMCTFFSIQAVFCRRAFDVLSEKSGEKIFRTAGLLLLIGAILTVMFIGFVLLSVAWILVAVGFFSMKGLREQVAGPPLPPSYFSVATDKRYCSNCGAENTSDADFCKHCGRRLQA
jgi:uncharacterized membrane protein